MILPDFLLMSRANLETKFNQIDSPERCLDPVLFAQYPHSVLYKYNSRGFRDEEWPEDLSHSTWCFGDSFTAGMGVPQNHLWPGVLQRKTHTRCINVSMDGASNQWLAKKITSLSQSLLPCCVIVHWSYINRREVPISPFTKTMNDHWKRFYRRIKDAAWPDCSNVNNFDLLPDAIKKEILTIHAGRAEHVILNNRSIHNQYDDETRRLWFDASCDEPADIDDIIDCIDRVNKLGLNVIHSFIPQFATKPAIVKIVSYLDQQQCRYVAPFDKLDLARDGDHYDIVTADYFTDQLIKLI